MFIILAIALSQLSADGSKVLVSDLALHSITSMLLQRVDKAVYLTNEISARGQVELIAGQLLIYDSQQDDFKLFLDLFFKEQNKIILDVRSIDGVSKGEFIYAPANIGVLAVSVANALVAVYPDRSATINSNLINFQRKIAKLQGALNPSDFFACLQNKDLLDEQPEDRYFIVLTKLGLWR